MFVSVPPIYVLKNIAGKSRCQQLCFATQRCTGFTFFEGGKGERRRCVLFRECRGERGRCRNCIR